MRPVLKVVAAATVMIGAQQAHATVITQTVQFGPGLTDYSNAVGVTGAGGTTFSYFDTTLGTLNSITFSSSYGFGSTISLTNTSTTPSNGNARTQSAAQFDSSASAVTTALNNAVNNLNDPVDGTGVSFGNSTLSPIAYDIRGSRSNYNLAAGGSTSFTSSGSGTTGPFVDTTASDLSAFSLAGGGTYTPLFTTLSGLVIANSGGNTSATQVTTATGTLSISYNYTAAVTPPPATVPEPASVLILGAGLAGLGMVRYRRRGRM